MTSEADGVMPSRRLELVADEPEELALALADALADGARAQHEDGDLRASRQSFERAYRLAEQVGDVQAMALAALGLAGLWLGERRTVTSAVLLEARLQHVLSLLDARSVLALRVRTRLAAEADYFRGTHTAILAARAYELLRPYADLPMIGSLGVTCFGSAQHALGVAALTTRQLGPAIEHLNAAVQHNLALAHWPALVASRQRLAQAHTLRGGPGDADAARRELDTAMAEAAAVGLPVPAIPSPARRRRSRSPWHSATGSAGSGGWSCGTAVS